MMKSNRFTVAASVVLAAGTWGAAGTALATAVPTQQASHNSASAALVPGNSQPVTLANGGAKALEMAIRFTGANPADFTQSNNCGEKLKGHAQCVINVTFAPKAPGKKSATMEIRTSGGTKYVYLTGTGV